MGDFRDTPTGTGVLGTVLTGQSEFGDIETNGDVDVFQTVLIAGLRYTIELRGAETGDGSLPDPELAIVDINGNDIFENDDSPFGGRNSRIDLPNDDVPDYTGTYYLAARSYEFASVGTGDYTIAVSAGSGSDAGETINGSASADWVKALGGTDTVRGNDGNDTLEGGLGNDALLGGAGNDFLEGGENNDTVRGQAGNDILRGGFQADIVVGGSGADVFQFLSTSGSVPGARDQFRAGDGGTAFDNAGNTLGDIFDLANIDANTIAGGNQAFQFGGTIQTGRGFVWLANSGPDTIVRGNTDNDAAAEFEIEIEDGLSVAASAYRAVDFIL